MPKVSFKKTEVPNAVAGDTVAEVVEQVQGEGSVTTVTAVAVREETSAPALPPSYGPTPDEIDMKDIVLPRLNIAQRVGELGENFPPGSIVFDASLELKQPSRIVVLGFAPTCFVEKVEGGGRGEVCTTEKEVVDAGGTLAYNEAKETDKPLYQRLARAFIFVECPEGVDSLAFPYEFGGKNYAFAQWSLKGTSYTKGAKIILTQRKIGALRDDARGGLRAAFWSLATATEKFANNTYYVPKLKLAESTTPEFRDWVTGIVGF